MTVVHLPCALLQAAEYRQAVESRVAALEAELRALREAQRAAPTTTSSAAGGAA
jgi:hypothetical protein